MKVIILNDKNVQAIRELDENIFANINNFIWFAQKLDQAKYEKVKELRSLIEANRHINSMQA